MLSELLILCCFMLSSSLVTPSPVAPDTTTMALSSVVAPDICDDVKSALNGYAQHRCVYDAQTGTLTLSGTGQPTATLNKIPASSVGNTVKQLAIVSLLSDISVDALENLNGLVSIQFENNSVKRLPTKTFSKSSTLQWLFFTGNPLESTFGFAELPRNMVAVSLGGSRVKRLTGLNDLPTSLERMDFGHNQLASFVMESSGRHQYALGNLVLNHNRIKEFYTPELSKLGWLNLSDNLLIEVSSDMLQGLRALRNLFLGRNRIERIDEDAFVHTPGLVEIDLQDNRIRVLSENIALPDLSRLSIDGNRLQYLHLKLFARSKLATVRLDGNPFNCGCLDDLLKWMDIYDVVIFCRERSFSGLAPNCVVHSSDTHYCPYQYYEEDVEYFFKHRYTKLLNESKTCY